AVRAVGVRARVAQTLAHVNEERRVERDLRRVSVVRGGQTRCCPLWSTLDHRAAVEELDGEERAALVHVRGERGDAGGALRAGAPGGTAAASHRSTCAGSCPWDRSRGRPCCRPAGPWAGRRSGRSRCTPR